MPSESQVLVFPAFSNNPYLELMQTVAQEDGFEFVHERVLTDLHTAGKRLAEGDVLHVHWTSPVAQGGADENDAWARVRTFCRLVDQLKDDGVRLVWTIHNRLPHELSYVDPELALWRFLVDRADAVHVLTKDTPAVVADLCPLPADRVHVIPHPSYEGVYGDPVPRNIARERLELGADEPTVLFFGRMRAYKGLDTLIAAVAHLTAREDTPPTLLLAGRARGPARAEIARLLPTSSRTVTSFDFVEPDQVPVWFGAADVAVFPFRSILNSGSVHLSATLGVPAILPGVPHLRNQFGDEPWVRFYDVDDAVPSLARLLATPDPVDHASAMAKFCERHSPRVVSRRYADLLAGLTPSTRVAAGARRGPRAGVDRQWSQSRRPGRRRGS